MKSVLSEPEGRGLKRTPKAGCLPVQPLAIAGKHWLLDLQRQLPGFQCSLCDFPPSASVSRPSWKDTDHWIRVTLMLHVLSVTLFHNKVILTGAWS